MTNRQAPVQPPATRKREVWPWVLPVLVALAIVFLFIYVELWSPAPDPGSPLSGKLDGVKEKTLDTILDLTKLFMTWSLAIIGAIAFFLKSAIEGKVTVTRGNLLAAELVILSSVISLFFGHLVFNSVLSMLALDLFNVQDSNLVAFSQAQYTSFLASLVLFGLYVHFAYWPGGKNLPGSG